MDQLHSLNSYSQSQQADAWMLLRIEGEYVSVDMC